MRLAALLPLAVLGLVAVVFGVLLFTGKEGPSSPLIGKPVPQFDLPPLEGEGVDEGGSGLASRDLSGNGPQLVNIWASWCGPCRAEHPLLEAISETVPIAGINYKDDPDAARQFLSALGNPFHRIGVDRDGRASVEWGVYGIPETFLVSGEGVVLWKHAGPLSEEIVREALLPLVERERQREAPAAPTPAPSS